ncbi:MAG TPA: histidine phosphatase family protein [Bryobacteraceae bacterium]|nr:histidine phosphatase family protein [Bryobacteraceae bacterium]
MALLTLVRHGQASFLKENYDQLSERGERQSRILGEHWLRTGAVFDQVYQGPACRHLHTAKLVEEVYRRAGAPWPEAVTLPDWDEYAGIRVVRTFLPGLMETHEDIRALEAEFRQAGEQDAAFRIFDRLFARITRMWVNEELASPDIEPWRDFCARIDRGIERVRANAGKNSRIVVFTSGGVIAATVRAALDLTPQRTLEMSWTSRNASYAEFLFSPERFSLGSFNNHPHLEDEDLLTYR